VSQVLSREVLVGGLGFFGGSWAQMAVTWSKWIERRVVNYEAMVSRSSVKAVDGVVLSVAEWREAVWLISSGVMA
jgi:hypothetical protein